jgi:hypothetical protein
VQHCQRVPGTLLQGGNHRSLLAALDPAQEFRSIGVPPR